MKHVITFMLFFTNSVIFGQSISNARVFAVHDGDSYKVRVEGSASKIWVRLWGVDCPEVTSNYIPVAQPYGKAIGDSLRVLLKGKTVQIDSIGLDIHNRQVVKVFLDSISITDYILSKGWGWYTPDYNNMTDEEVEYLKVIHDDAKTKRIGLWSDSKDPIRPSTWRRIYKK